MDFPDLLKPGDSVAVVSPAKNVPKRELEGGIQLIESWGLEVRVGQHAFSSYGRFAGNDSDRRSDFNQALQDPAVKAIFCSRGGYGTTRILDGLRLDSLLDYPKWIVGFSDITGLLIHLSSMGIASVHGPVPIQYGEPSYSESVNRLRYLLFDGRMDLVSEHNQPSTGEAEGRLIGGNLSLLTHLVGTPSDFDSQGKILFIEEVDEAAYRIDRMMIQLRRSGHLDGLHGLIVGHLTGIKETSAMKKSAIEIILDYAVGLGIPVATGFPIGHEPPNHPVVIGQEVKLSVQEERATLRPK